jgi:hypothetical protein
MLLKTLAAQKICDERSLVMTSKQQAADPDVQDPDCEEPSDSESETENRSSKGPEHGSAPAIRKVSDYEITRSANIARNKELAEQLNGRFWEVYGSFLPEVEETAPKPARKKREKKTLGTAPRRSARNNQEP